MNTIETSKEPQSTSRILVITNGLESKIRHLCRENWDIEWSGILFYDYAYDSGSLTLTAKDLILMDIGSAGYTEYDMDADVVAYMTENNLVGCQFGHIHSHNNMQAFFSGTDMSTLLEEGKKCNNFLSLVVNNKGSYVAKITYKVKCREYMNMLFDKQFKKEYTETEKVDSWDLSIVFEDDNDGLVDRITEVRKKKEEKKIVNMTDLPLWKKYEGKEEWLPVREAKIESLEPDDLEHDRHLQQVADKLLACLVTGAVYLDKNITFDKHIDVKKADNLWTSKFKSLKGLNSFVEDFVDLMFWNEITRLDSEYSKHDDADIANALSTYMLEKLEKYEDDEFTFIPILKSKLYEYISME